MLFLIAGIFLLSVYISIRIEHTLKYIKIDKQKKNIFEKQDRLERVKKRNDIYVSAFMFGIIRNINKYVHILPFQIRVPENLFPCIPNEIRKKWNFLYQRDQKIKTHIYMIVTIGILISDFFVQFGKWETLTPLIIFNGFLGIFNKFFEKYEVPKPFVFEKEL